MRMDRFHNPHSPAHTIRAFFQSGFDEVETRFAARPYLTEPSRFP